MKRSLIGMHAALFCCLTSVAQQPGDLDTTFSGDGKLTIAGFGQARSLAMQPDGKIMVLTSVTDSMGDQLAVVRLSGSGLLDSSYAMNGVRTFSGAPSQASAVWCQPDSRLLIVGATTVSRLHEDSSLDTTFGDGGAFLPSIPGGNNTIHASYMLPDGSLLVGGHVAHPYPLSYSDGWLTRLMPSGDIDMTFGVGGFVLFPSDSLPNSSRTVRDIDVRGDGAIAVGVGTTACLRLDQNGQLPPYQFYGGNSVYLPMAMNSSGAFMMFQVQGFWNIATWYFIHVTAPDTWPPFPSVVAHQMFYSGPGQSPVTGGYHAVETDTDDAFLFAGAYYPSFASGWDIWKFDADGAWDSTFAGSGHVNTVFEIGEHATAYVIRSQSDGKVIVAGIADINGTQHLALARYHNIPDPRARLSAKVFLGGPYNALDQRMNDGLRTNGLLPQQQPYAALGDSAVSNPDALFAWPGTMDITGDSAVVDWVWLELLSAADSATVLGSRAALLLRNGCVVERDGRSPVDMNCGAGSYFLRIRHRNHLSATCSDPLQLSDSPTSVDFTSPATNTFGTDAQKEVNGVRMLWPGDATGNGAVKYAGLGNDRDPILLAIGGSNVLGTIGGYHREDTSMDGVVKYTGLDNDRDIILQSIGGSNVLAVRYEQLP